jgi:hypothetical protein
VQAPIDGVVVVGAGVGSGAGADVGVGAAVGTAVGAEVGTGVGSLPSRQAELQVDSSLQ